MTSADFSVEEGEIPEAFPLPRFHKEALVDRVERTRSSRSNDHEYAHDVRTHRRSRSRSPRGFKRPLDDRGRRDEKFRTSSYLNQENQRLSRELVNHNAPSYRGPYRGQYRDLDRPQSRGSYGRENDHLNNPHQSHTHYDERGHQRSYNQERPNKRHRNRSRSPRYYDDRNRRERANDYVNAQIGFQPARRPAPEVQAPSASNQLTKPDRNGRVEQGFDNLSVSQASEIANSPAQNADPEPDFDWDPAQESQKKAEEEAERERKRRARASARAKATSTPDPMQVDTPDQSSMPSPSTFDLTKPNGDTAATRVGLSAAGYDPTADSENEKKKQKPEEEEDGGLDLFAETIDEEMLAKLPQVLVNGPTNGNTDPDAWYRFRVGDLMGPDNRYRVLGELGKGMYASVGRAEDRNTHDTVAIKAIRNNAAMRSAASTEIAILRKLMASDPDDKRHVIRLKSTFQHGPHYCMVFENMDSNLREVVSKYGKDVGINIRAVKRYAVQIFTALAYMHAQNIIHADLKPDNILVDSSKINLKICDFGTAIDRDDAATNPNDLTPYLVSRFYRAPEIILGIPYGTAVDVWAIGCTLYELYTGKILFTGATNNQMLRVIQEIRGKLGKFARQSPLYAHHFDENGNFESRSTDENGKEITKIIQAFPQRSRIHEMVMPRPSEPLPEDEKQDLLEFIGLINECLNPNPEKRITAKSALQHPFFHKPPPKASGTQKYSVQTIRNAPG